MSLWFVASSSHSIVGLELIPSLIERAEHAGANHALFDSGVLLDL